MVRTLPFRSTSRPDPARVLAIVMAIALHLLALLLLLIPVATYRPDTAPATPRTEPWVQKVQIVPPPRPPETVPVTQPRTPLLLPQTLPRTVPRTPAPVIDAIVTEHALPASDTGATDDTTTAIDTGPAIAAPLAVASLAYVRAPAPPYPRDALRAGAQGTVLLKVLVGTDGSPLEVAVERSSGNRSLDREAVRQVRQHWRFQPAMHDGRVVRAYGMVPIVFSLQ